MSSVGRQANRPLIEQKLQSFHDELALSYAEVLPRAVEYIKQHHNHMIETRSVIIYDIHTLGTSDHLLYPADTFNRQESTLEVYEVPEQPFLYIDINSGVLYDEGASIARFDDPVSAGYLLTPDVAYKQETMTLSRPLQHTPMSDPPTYIDSKGTIHYMGENRFASLMYLQAALRRCENIYLTRFGKFKRLLGLGSH